jgi:ESCRT-II complex subunit VPS22
MQMCMKIGVDPLASSKGFWTENLGIGDFYYEVAVQVMEIALKTRAANGGLIDLDNLHANLLKLRRCSSSELTLYDVERSIKILQNLGGGIDIIAINAQRFLKTVPGEMRADALAVFADINQGNKQYTTQSRLKEALGWPTERIQAALEDLLKRGTVWLDDASSADDHHDEDDDMRMPESSSSIVTLRESRYYPPALFPGFEG